MAFSAHLGSAAAAVEVVVGDVATYPFPGVEHDLGFGLDAEE